MELLKPCSKADYPAYSVAFTGTAGNTDAWAAGPQGVLVWASQACYVEVGVAAVATTASTPIPANTPFYIALQTSIGRPVARQRDSSVNRRHCVLQADQQGIRHAFRRFFP